MAGDAPQQSTQEASTQELAREGRAQSARRCLTLQRHPENNARASEAQQGTASGRGRAGCWGAAAGWGGVSELEVAKGKQTRDRSEAEWRPASPTRAAAAIGQCSIPRKPTHGGVREQATKREEEEEEAWAQVTGGSEVCSHRAVNTTRAAGSSNRAGRGIQGCLA